MTAPGSSTNKQARLDHSAEQCVFQNTGSRARPARHPSSAAAPPNDRQRQARTDGHRPTSTSAGNTKPGRPPRSRPGRQCRYCSRTVTATRASTLPQRTASTKNRESARLRQSPPNDIKSPPNDSAKVRQTPPKSAKRHKKSAKRLRQGPPRSARLRQSPPNDIKSPPNDSAKQQRT